MKQSTIFFGSSKYSVIDEKALFENFGLSLVVTLPDRENSKTKQITANPVKQFAKDNNTPVITTEKITPDIIEQIATYHPDFLVVADFGLILPKALLQLPTKAAINVHHSLLPKYRGPAPVPFAILAGEKTLGVTIIMMTPKVDAGDMLSQKTYRLSATDTTDSVLTKLNEIGSSLAVEVLKDFDTYFAKRIPQDESQATFSHYMQRNDGYIDMDNPLEIAASGKLVPSGVENWKLKIERAVRAYYPWPGVWTKWQMANGASRIVKLLPNSNRHSGKPEARPESKEKRSWTSQDDGMFLLQVEGKKPMSYKDFMNGYAEGKSFLQKLGLI